VEKVDKRNEVRCQKKEGEKGVQVERQISEKGKRVEWGRRGQLSMGGGSPQEENGKFPSGEPKGISNQRGGDGGASGQGKGGGEGGKESP